MDEKKKWNEILSMSKTIGEEIFRKKESQPSPIRIRIFNAKAKSFSWKVIRLRYCADSNSDFDVEPANLMGGFLLELADELWHHKQHMRPEYSEDIWLGEDRSYLQAGGRCLRERGYSERVIGDVTKLLDKDLAERFEKLKGTQDYKYFFPANPLSHPWIARENDVIAQIRSIYKKYTPLTNRQIISSMAIVFSASDFWDDGKERGDIERISTYFERIKKRFQTVDRHHPEPPEMFDPPYRPQK